MRNSLSHYIKWSWKIIYFNSETSYLHSHTGIEIILRSRPLLIHIFGCRMCNCLIFMCIFCNHLLKVESFYLGVKSHKKKKNKWNKKKSEIKTKATKENKCESFSQCVCYSQLFIKLWLNRITRIFGYINILHFAYKLTW